MVRFLANSQPAEGISREQLLGFFADHQIDASTWDLVRHRIVTENLFKVGARPGVVLFLEADSLEAAAAIVNALPIVEAGLLTFEIDPVSPVAHF